MKQEGINMKNYNTPKLSINAVNNPYLENVLQVREVSNPVAEEIKDIVTNEKSLGVELAHSLGQILGMLDSEVLSEEEKLDVEEALCLLNLALGR
jgi:hypothetical protein